MANDLAHLARVMLRVESTLPQSVNRLIKGLALDIDRGVILDTPVDVGTARSNWVVSLGSPSVDFISAYAPGVKLGKSEKANAGKALDQGRTVINSRQPGQTVVIQNNAPYIGILNEGYSRQSPALFIESAIISAVKNLDGRTLKVI